MSLVSRKEYAAISKTTVSNVNVYVRRGKVIVEDNGLVDTENPINKMTTNNWIKLHFEKEEQRKLDALRKEAQEKVQSKNEIKGYEKPKVEKAVKRGRKPKTKVDKHTEELLSMEQRKKRADTLLQERKAELEKLKLDKMAGKLIPVDLVFQVLNIHNKSIFATFQSDVENLASVFCEILAEGDRSKLSDVTQKISEKLVETVKKSKELAELELDNAVAEYAETRSRGERK
jgi:hypothetical protein